MYTGLKKTASAMWYGKPLNPVKVHKLNEMGQIVDKKG